MKVRIKFQKYGVMKFIGHLDVMRFFQKVMRRADIPIAFTKGMSPHMIMSFAQPLGVGVTSEGEYVDIELREPISTEAALKQMNAVMVDGMSVSEFKEISDEKKDSGMSIVAAANYNVHLLESYKDLEGFISLPDDWEEKAKEFMDLDTCVILKKTKKSEKETDIRPMIYDFKVDAQNNDIYLYLATGSERNLKPDLVMKAFLNFLGLKEEDYPMSYHRIDVFAKNPDAKEGADYKDQFIPLGKLGKDIILANETK